MDAERAPVLGTIEPAADSEAALAAAFRDHFDTLFGFCIARTGSRQVAEEVASDTFAEAARVFAAGNGHVVGPAWLTTVARRRLIDHWRRAERHRRRIEKLRRARPQVSTTQCDSDRDPEVVAALATLPERQRAAVVLRYLDDFSVTEVAEALEMSYSAVESLLARGRRSFAAAYRKARS